MNPKRNEKLIEENRKLRQALSGLMPWVGESPDGPSWATQEAKAKNREMFEMALNEARECFPPNYNERREIAESN